MCKIDSQSLYIYIWIENETYVLNQSDKSLWCCETAETDVMNHTESETDVVKLMKLTVITRWNLLTKRPFLRAEQFLFIGSVTTPRTRTPQGRPLSMTFYFHDTSKKTPQDPVPRQWPEQTVILLLSSTQGGRSPPRKRSRIFFDACWTLNPKLARSAEKNTPRPKIQFPGNDLSKSWFCS